MSGLPPNPLTHAQNGNGNGAASTSYASAGLPAPPSASTSASMSGAGAFSPAGSAPGGTGVASPMAGPASTPGGAGGGAGGPEQPKRAHLYVGNLSGRVTEYMLTEIFAVAGPVASVKIIPDRNFTHGGLNYGFVEYSSMRHAEQALATLNGRKIFDTEIRVNWAYQNQLAGGAAREDTQGHFHVFVGDLSPEVNDEVLGKAFAAFGTMSEARVMWDMSSGKSRGYGFLAFREKADAEQAIATMNGEWLGSRAIRVNWANQKTQTGGGSRPPGMGMGMGVGPSMGGGPGGATTMAAPAPPPVYTGGPLDYETVLKQTPAYNTTVYVGNLIPYTSQADLVPLFQGYGYIVEIRMQADRGFAFVKLDTHENAALAIVQLQNQLVHGRPVKCSWGKDRDGGASAGGGGAASPAQGLAQQPGGMGMGMMGMQGYGGMQQMYGLPSANSFGQYGAPHSMASPGGWGAATGHHDPNAVAVAAYYQQHQQAAASAPQWGSYYGGQAGGQ